MIRKKKKNRKDSWPESIELSVPDIVEGPHAKLDTRPRSSARKGSGSFIFIRGPSASLFPSCQFLQPDLGWGTAS